jgi:hypothetical protein
MKFFYFILSLCVAVSNGASLWANLTMWPNVTEQHITKRADTAVDGGNYFGSSKNDVTQIFSFCDI